MKLTKERCKFTQSSYRYLFVYMLGYLMASSDVQSYEEDLKHLKEQVDAGADLIITQMFFEVKTFIKFVEDCQRYGINVPVIPAIFPIQVCSDINTLKWGYSLYIYLMASSDVHSYEEDLKHLKHQSSLRQRGRAVRAPDLKSVGRGFKSRSDR